MLIPEVQPTAATILDLFDRDVDRHIEEVIKVDSTDAATVRQEIEEYVPTGPIRRNYVKILERFEETPKHPHESIGVWISGFFGAGKSTFAKILGYVLENRSLGGVRAADLFTRQTGDVEIEALLRQIHQRIPTRSIILDVSTEQSATEAAEKLTDVVYRVLLRELDYSTDREIAELEIELEGRGELAGFEDVVARVTNGKKWSDLKKLAATARNTASRTLHELDPNTYPSPETWARTRHAVHVSPNFVAERAWELARRRADGRALVFVIDEVGQYVARSTEKMLDLQGLVQALGRVGKERAASWTGQVWLVVTSQERLSEVVDNLEGRAVELARLRDRFPIEVDLAPDDIREVTAQRVLKKKPHAKVLLERVFQENAGRLGAATRLEGRLAGPPLDASSFAELYPFLPYQVELLIDVVSALRRQSGASRHVGGANRTIIKLAQQVLVNEQTRLGDAPVGRLVTLDLLYPLLTTQVSSERKRDVAEIAQSFGADAMETRVARALALLHFVEALPRSPENLAALLHPAADAAPMRREVETALEELRKVGKVRVGEKGWELLSGVGRTWEDERRGLGIMPRQRGAVVTTAAEQLFRDVPAYRHRNLRSFSVSPYLNGQPLGRSSGHVDLRMDLVSDAAAADTVRERARTASNTDAGTNALHWVVLPSEDVLREVEEVARSREMIQRYRSRQLVGEQAQLLADEIAREKQHEARVLSLLSVGLARGDAFFRGVRTPIQDHGDTLYEAVRGALATAAPRLFPHFDDAAVAVKGDETRKLLESESLAGLPPVFYDGADGLGLVKRDGGVFRVDPTHPAMAAVRDYIVERSQYGEEASGRLLESRFTGFGYGWDPETVTLLAAALLRAAEIEVYAGKRYTSYADPGVRDVFRKVQTFRSASFTPRRSAVDFPLLARCTQALEALYGERVAIEEGALAAAIRRRMPGEALCAHRIAGTLQANDLPGAEAIASLAAELEGIAQDAAQDTVLAFHAQTDAIRAGLELLRKLEGTLSPTNLAVLKGARAAMTQLWPQLESLGLAIQLAAELAALRDALGSADFHAHLPLIGQRADAIKQVYDGERKRLFEAVDGEASRVLDELRNRPEWEALPATAQDTVAAGLRAVRSKAESPAATLSELDNARLALDRLYLDAVAELIRQANALEQGSGGVIEPVVQRIRAARFAAHGLRTRADVDNTVEAIRTTCYEVVDRNETVVLE